MRALQKTFPAEVSSGMTAVWFGYSRGGRYGVRSHFFEPEGGVVFELRGFPLRVDVLVPLRLPNHGRNALARKLLRESRCALG